MKYIMLREAAADGSGLTSFFPIIFPEYLTHSEVADTLLAAYPRPVEVVSAGNVLFDKSPVSVRMRSKCYGDSYSCKLSSHSEDSAIIDYGSAMRYMWNARKGCKTYSTPE